jgi:hypothetical protein
MRHSVNHLLFHGFGNPVWIIISYFLNYLIYLIAQWLDLLVPCWQYFSCWKKEKIALICFKANLWLMSFPSCPHVWDLYYFNPLFICSLFSTVVNNTIKHQVVGLVNWIVNSREGSILGIRWDTVAFAQREWEIFRIISQTRFKLGTFEYSSNTKPLHKAVIFMGFP